MSLTVICERKKEIQNISNSSFSFILEEPEGGIVFRWNMRSSLLKDRGQWSLSGSHAMAGPDYASLSVWQDDLGSNQQHKFHIIFARPELSFSDVSFGFLSLLKCHPFYVGDSMLQLQWLLSFEKLFILPIHLPLLPFSRTACQICHASVGFPSSFLTFVSICWSFLSVTHGLLEDVADVWPWHPYSPVYSSGLSSIDLWKNGRIFLDFCHKYWT